MNDIDTYISQSAKDRSAVCTMRKELGLLCSNCVYYTTCKSHSSAAVKYESPFTNTPKPIICKETGYVFQSIADAARVLGVSSNKVRNLIRSKEPLQCSFTLEFYGDNNDNKNQQFNSKQENEN